MPDILNENGLQVKTLNDIISDLETGFRGIYGEDINLDQNSPDGQTVNLFAQACIDIRELLVQVNNGFDPDRAIGAILDERVVINNIERQGGTFTITPVTLVVDRTVSLQGLDANYNDINGTGYTVQDNAGNEFILIDSTTLTSGTYSLNFRARNIGLVETTVGTITNPVTVVLGVTSINNPSGALEIGINEETDAQLRLRRQRSVAIASTGYLNGLLAAVFALSGVSDAKLYENVTDTTDANGIPAHSIWLIVEGGANTDIANEIYKRKSSGCGMRGAVEIDITTSSGAVFAALFDRPTAENLYIRFDLKATVSGASFNQAAIKQYIVDNTDYSIGGFAETASVTALCLEAINSQGGGGVPINVEISTDGSTWVDYLDTATLDKQFTVDTSRITITLV